MRAFINRLGSAFLRKLAFYALISALGLGTYALWLFVRGSADAESHRLARIVELAEQRDQFQLDHDEAVKQLAALQAEQAMLESRVRQADAVIGQLHGLENWWDRLVGNRAQQKANEEQIGRMMELKRDAEKRLVGSRRLVVRTTWALEDADEGLARARQELSEAKRIETPVLFYLNEAWNRGKGWLAWLLVACLCARTAGKIFLYFGVAPVILRGRPVRLAKSQAITAVTSRIPGDFGVELWPGESLRVKRGFLRASSDAFTRGRRLVLNGAIPLTCARCGLTWMIELRNRHAGGGRLVVLGQADGSGGELTMIAVPEGASVVLRPRFLVGVITKAGERLVIRRRWPLLRWQSWVTREFRFLEFTGPCRLIVAARGGVRVERLVEQDGQPQALLRIEQEVIIGFTPTLNYQPVKAVSFWSYYRGRGPLFARLLSGSGLCLLQEKAPQHG